MHPSGCSGVVCALSSDSESLRITCLGERQDLSRSLPPTERPAQGLALNKRLLTKSVLETVLGGKCSGTGGHWGVKPEGLLPGPGPGEGSPGSGWPVSRCEARAA